MDTWVNMAGTGSRRRSPPRGSRKEIGAPVVQVPVRSRITRTTESERYKLELLMNQAGHHGPGSGKAGTRLFFFFFFFTQLGEYCSDGSAYTAKTCLCAWVLTGKRPDQCAQSIWWGWGGGFWSAPLPIEPIRLRPSHGRQEPPSAVPMKTPDRPVHVFTETF